MFFTEVFLGELRALMSTFCPETSVFRDSLLFNGVFVLIYRKETIVDCQGKVALWE